MSEKAFAAVNRAKNMAHPNCAKYPQEFCGARHDGFRCSRPKEHDGPHEAHGLFASVCDRWIEKEFGTDVIVISNELLQID